MARVVAAAWLLAVVGCGGNGTTASSVAADAGTDGAIGKVACADADLQTDPHHCGRCDHDCLGGSCSAGTCQEVAISTGEADPFRVAIAPDQLLWLSDALRSYSLVTGETRTVYTPASPLRALATDGTTAVVALEDGTVVRVDLASGTSATVATGQDRVNAIRASGADYYWVNFGDSKLMHLPANGPAVELRHDLCWPIDLLIHEGTAFALSGSCRAILAAPIGSADAASVLTQDLSGDMSPSFGAATDTSIAWLNAAGRGGLRVTNIADASTREIFTPGPNSMTGAANDPVELRAVAADATYAYYATANERGAEDGHVYRVPLAGGAAEAVSSSEVTILGVAVDPRLVAWTAIGPYRGQGQGRVYLRAK